MSKEKEIYLNTEINPSKNPEMFKLEELSALISGDYEVFHTLVSEVNQLEIPEEEKNKKLEILYKAAKDSGVNFLTANQNITNPEDL